VHGRNQVSLDVITFRSKDSGFVGNNEVSLVALRIWRDDGTIRNDLVVGYIVWLGLDVLWNK
jgi:hypothetical protein